jgi:type I restriction enzyme S subunit
MIYDLLDLYEVKSGMGNKSRNDFDPNKYNNHIIMFKEIFYNSKLPDKNELSTTVNLKYGELQRFDIKMGDILLTSSSETPNELAMSSVALSNYPNTVYSGFSKRLRPITNLTHPQYMRYWFRSDKFRNYINSTVSMTTRANLNMSILSSIKVDLPNLDKQKAIANILASLDDKIELNNKINQNLKELAQTLYKRWFVDFEFPNENGDPYQSSGGDMVESELGLIPKAWEVVSIGNICNTVLGGTPSRKKVEFWNGDINWINSGEVNNFRIVKATEKISLMGLEKSSTKLMPKKTTVIAITGATLGAVSLLEVESCANQSVIGILENDKLPYSYIFSTIQYKIIDLIGRQTGGAQQHINKNDVNSYKIILPNFHILETFHNLVDALHNQIANNLFQNQKLSELRDTLLPKLMSGEIEVPIEGNA